MWIAIWTKRGEDVEVPAGWHICDGAFGTPDLRGRFIRGSYGDKTYPPGKIGGDSGYHNHTNTTLAGNHSHELSSGGGHTHTLVTTGTKFIDHSTASYNIDPVSDHTHTTSEEDHIHNLSLEENVPPYYTVMYIAYVQNPLHAPDAPVGCIAHWSGPAWTIPPGWVVCDGTRGTPDLRLKFLRGAQTAGEGEENEGHSSLSAAGNHVHTVVASGAHTHAGTRAGTPLVFYSTNVPDYLLSDVGDHTHTISTSVGEHSHDLLNPQHSLPAYYCLYFIQKVL